MKKLLVIPSILIVLLGVAVIAPSFIDWSQYRPQIEAQAEKATGYDIILGGDLSLSVLPFPQVSVKDVTVKAPEGLKSDYLVKLERLDLGLALFPLFTGQIEVSGIDLVGADIVLQVGADGKPRGLSPQMGGETASSETAENTPEKSAKDIAINNVSIKDGRVRLINDKSGQEQIFENINMNLSAASLSGPFKIAGGLRTMGLDIDLDGAAGRLEKGAATTVNVAANINGNAALTYAGVIETGAGFALQGETTLDIDNPEAFAASMGMKGVSYNKPATVKSLLSINSERVTLDNLQLKSGANEAQGKIIVALNPLAGVGDIRSLENDFGQRVIAEFKAVTKGANIQITDGTFALGPSTAKVSGTYNPKAESLDFTMRLNEFDTAQFNGGSSASSDASGGDAAAQKKAIQKAAASLSVPLNINADIVIDEGTLNGLDFKALKLNGSAEKSGLVKISRASIQDIEGAQIVMQGEVADIAALSGINGSVSLTTSDIRSTARGFGADASFLPENISSMNLTINATGDADAMDVTMNARAMSGEVIAKGRFIDPLGGALTTDKLALQIKHPNLANAVRLLNSQFSPPTAAFSRPVDFYGDVALGQDRYAVSNIKAQILGAPLAGNIDIITGGARPDINGALIFGALDLGKNTKSVKANAARAASGSAPQQGQTGAKSYGTSRWSLDPIDAGFLRALDFNLTLKAASLKYAGWDLTEPVLAATQKDGTLKISELSAGLYGGKLKTDALIEKRQNDLFISANPSIQNVSLEPLVGSLVRNKLLAGKGRINMDAALETTGGTQSALIRGLTGQGDVSGTDLVLEGIDLTRFAGALSDESKPADSLLGLWQGASAGGSTGFSALDGNYTISKGVVNIAKLDLTGAQADIATTGTISLPQWALATKHTITLKGAGALPPFTMEFEGPLDNPAQTFGKGALENYLERKIKRKIGKELGGELGQKIEEKLGIPGLFRTRSGDAAPAQQAPADNIRATQPDNGSANTAPAPANDNNTIQRVEPKSVEEEVIRGVLDGLFSQ